MKVWQFPLPAPPIGQDRVCVKWNRNRLYRAPTGREKEKYDQQSGTCVNETGTPKNPQADI